jgi:hypothetical protein
MLKAQYRQAERQVWVHCVGGWWSRREPLSWHVIVGRFDLPLRPSQLLRLGRVPFNASPSTPARSQSAYRTLRIAITVLNIQSPTWYSDPAFDH